MDRVSVYNAEEVKLEAKRCLSCKKPLCEEGCPIHNNIRDFIKALKEDDLALASNLVYDNSKLAFICSVVCPHEDNCMGHCVLNRAHKPINVGGIEAYITHNTKPQKPIIKRNGKQALVVGAGPAGLYAAFDLSKAGYAVTIHEATNHLGGVLSYGIPDYRLAAKHLARLEELVRDYEITVKYNSYLTEKEIIALKEEYSIIILACGLTASRSAGLGESKRIIDATTLLKDYNLKTKYEEGQLPTITGNVAVIGAGNVAMDAARVLVRLGAKVDVLYRRSREEAPATKEEISLAEAEGVVFNFLQNPVAATENLEGITLKLEKMVLGEPDSSGRRRPVGTKEYFTKEFSYVVAAIGQIPASDLNFSEIKTDHGYVVTTSDFKTNLPGIYAIGDLTLGAKTVVEACASAKEAVRNILNELANEN